MASAVYVAVRACVCFVSCRRRRRRAVVVPFPCVRARVCINNLCAYARASSRTTALPPAQTLALVRRAIISTHTHANTRLTKLGVVCASPPRARGWNVSTNLYISACAHAAGGNTPSTQTRTQAATKTCARATLSHARTGYLSRDTFIFIAK